MMRWLLLVLVVSTLFLWLLFGCAANELGTMSGADADSDSDSDSDTDVDADSDVDIVYPEHIPHLDIHGLMTGPISPDGRSLLGPSVVAKV